MLRPLTEFKAKEIRKAYAEYFAKRYDDLLFEAITREDVMNKKKPPRKPKPY